MDEFIYLGSVFTSDCKSDADIERRLKLSKAAAAGINSLLWSPRIKRIQKVRLIFCFVYPVLSYSCETWSISPVYKKKLDVQWMKWMRRCYGCTIFDKIRNAKILKTLFPDDAVKQLNMTGMISERQDRYVGHIFRMPNDRGVKLSLTASFPNQNDFRHTKINWRHQALTKLALKTKEEITILYSKPKKK